MMKKLLWAAILVGNVANASEAVNVETNSTKVSASGIVPVVSNASTKASGWYAGVGMGLVNWGGSVTVDNGYSTQTIDNDTEDKPMMLKVGYVTQSENRVELYYKKDSIDTTNASNQDRPFDTSTFGINYQWGLSSLSTNEMLPYIRVGIGFGSGDADWIANDLNAIDFDIGLGVHYQVAPKIDVSAGIYRRAVGISTDNSDDSVIAAMNGVEIGANYHF